MNPTGKILVALGNPAQRAEVSRLLATAGHTVGAAAVTPAAPAPAVLPQTGGKAILLVEDEPEIREITELFLRAAGHVVFIAETGPEALTVWAEHAAEIGLVLTDMTMPGGMTGRELADRLLAGLASQADLREGFNYLQKPFSPGLLLDLVSERFAHGG